MRLFSLAAFVSLPVVLAATPAAAGTTAEPFVPSRDRASFDRSLDCLTQAIYYEARSESEEGQRAVAQVVLNRVRHPAFPNSVCGVVYQGSTRVTGCQFSFTCDGSMNRGVNDSYAWDRARRIAAAALRGSVYRPVGLATNYHTTAIRPYWAPSLVRRTVVGAHIFYTRPDSPTIEAFSQAPSDFEPAGFGARAERLEDLRIEDVDDASLGRRRAGPAQQPRVPARDRWQPIQIAEIPVPERRLIYRSYGPRPQPARAAAAAAPRRQAERVAQPRRGPRVIVQGGVRIVQGGGPY